MNPLFETLKNYKLPESPPKTKATGKAAHRKYILEELKRLIDWDDTKVEKPLWRWFQFPTPIPTEWIEGWKDDVILHSGNKKKRKDKLFELLKESRNDKS